MRLSLLLICLFATSLALAKPKRVIVVGGGIAGMTAANELQKQGYDVLILEKNPKLGGRLSSSKFGDLAYDLGAQIIPSRSTRILQLIKELDLEKQLVEVSTGVALARNGKLFHASLNNPPSLIYSGYIGIWELLNPTSLWNLVKLLSTSGRPIDDITAWKYLDTETVSSWSLHNQLGILEEWILDPILSPIFGNPRTTSKSSLFWIYDYVAHSPQVFSLRNGLGQISDSLSQRIPNQVNTKVEKINEAEDGVHLITQNKEFVADYVVLATTAPVTQKLLPIESCAYDASLLESTHYYSTIVLNIETNRSWQEIPQLKDTYSILIPHSESNEIQAVALGSAFGDRVKYANQNLFQIYFRDEFAKTHFQTPLSELKALAVTQLEKYIPGFAKSVVNASVQYWENAIPISEPSKAEKIELYLNARHQKKDCRIVLAGDYLNFSAVEPAAQTGAAAASEINLKRATSHPLKD